MTAAGTGREPTESTGKVTERGIAGKRDETLTFEEKTICSDIVYHGKLIDVRRDIVTTVDGQSSREIVEHADGVVIAALKPNGNIIMERQYRKPVEDVVFEIPAGKMDPGEEMEEAALRELREETGYTPEHIRFLTSSWPSVGFSREVLHVFLATGLHAGETDLDDNEAIDLEEHHIDELYDMVMRGKLTDGKSQVAILMVKGLIDRGELDDYLE